MSSMTLNTTPYVLLFKTDEDFAQRASLDLREAGYTPVIVSETGKGLRQLNDLQPAMVVLDHAFGGDSGLQFCHQLRKNRQPHPCSHVD